jgi:hypothetical protein
MSYFSTMVETAAKQAVEFFSRRIFLRFYTAWARSCRGSILKKVQQ